MTLMGTGSSVLQASMLNSGNLHHQYLSNFNEDMYLLGLSGLVPTHKFLKRLARLNHKWNLHGRDPIVAEYLSKLHHDHLNTEDFANNKALNQTLSQRNDNSLSRDNCDSMS